MADADAVTSQAQSPAQVPGSAFSLGWLMAQLYGPLQRPRNGENSGHLPTVAELDTDEQMKLAFAELEHLLSPAATPSAASIAAAWKAPGHKDFPESIMALHLNLLEQFINDSEHLSAYQLGRALSDTCWLPTEKQGADFFLRQFSYYRLATLQTWMIQANDALPGQSAAIVSRSLENWQDWAEVNARKVKSTWKRAHWSVIAALRTQARAWHAVLAGQPGAIGPTTPDAWTQAGQAILRTVGTLTLAVLRRFWPVVGVVAAATGGVLYLAITDSSGTAKVWTSLVTVAAALGVTGASVRASARRAAGGIKQDIWRTANLDAQAWSVTWLPTLRQGSLTRARLARRGVAVPQATNRLEKPGSSG
jgi:hypothetical protein